ncbi:hypothetical protein ATANTOWER_027175 [Ataeniobius toweri]|uniref:Uncharacterized protein n=1 Tax=Ataeniobius toweri TaxID=208326 RepID=A0ABU7BB14_9TELE|nr:hypothetical protein [Ataeniobius toweri]
MFKLFHSKLLLSAQNTTSHVNRAEEKLSESTKLKKASTVNKGLTDANLRTCGVGRLILSAGQTARYCCNHGDAVPLSFLQTGKTAPLGVVETGSLLGTLYNTVCFCRPQRESSNACTLITPFMHEYRIHKEQFIPA